MELSALGNTFSRIAGSLNSEVRHWSLQFKRVFPGGTKKYHSSGELCVRQLSCISSNTMVSQNAFSWCYDLKIFGTVEAIVNALKSRFDGF